MNDEVKTYLKGFSENRKVRLEEFIQNYIEKDPCNKISIESFNNNFVKYAETKGLIIEPAAIRNMLEISLNNYDLIDEYRGIHSYKGLKWKR